MITRIVYGQPEKLFGADIRLIEGGWWLGLWMDRRRVSHERFAKLSKAQAAARSFMQVTDVAWRRHGEGS